MILSALMAVYVVFSAISYMTGRKNEKGAENTALIGTLIALGISIIAYMRFDFSVSGMQLVENVTWIQSLGISYKLGVDGLSMIMILLSTFLMVFATMISKYLVEDKKAIYYPIIMMLGLSMVGVFISLDFFLFYIFWEIVLVFMYFLIAMWGGPKRGYASIKFLVYTHVGSLVMLLAIIAMYIKHLDLTGIRTFDIVTLTSFEYSLGFQNILFLAFLFAFIVKMPIFPFHTWLPDAHVEAPTAGSVLLAGILLKMGAYGLLRIPYTAFPQAAITFSGAIIVLALFSAVYSAFVSLVQTDLKKMIAYSSVTHMALVLLGIASLNTVALNGAIYGMVAHGLIAPMMFALAGIIHHSYGTREIGDLKGIVTATPRIGWLLIIGSLAAFGLPVFAGFVAEFMILIGSYIAIGNMVFWALLAVLVTAAYMLWMLQRIAFSEKTKDFQDLTGKQLIPLALLLFFIVLLGIYPSVLLNMTETLQINAVTLNLG